MPACREIVFVEGSITEDQVLAGLEADLDYVFHLATYHGNQSSIHDPLADHANNTLTTLKLYERIKRFDGLKRVVYSSAGCAVAEKTFDTAQATTEEAPVSLTFDSPYSISKLIGELYSNYYFQQHGLPVVRAQFQNVYGPGEILGAGQWRGTPATVWRNVTPTFIYRALKQMPLISGKRRYRDAGLYLCSGYCVRPAPLRRSRHTRRGLQPRQRRRDLYPGTGEQDQPDHRQSHRASHRPEARLGSVRQALWQHGEGQARTGLRGRGLARSGPRSDRRVDPAEFAAYRGGDAEA